MKHPTCECGVGWREEKGESVSKKARCAPQLALSSLIVLLGGGMSHYPAAAQLTPPTSSSPGVKPINKREGRGGGLRGGSPTTFTRDQKSRKRH
jgi:hypothetical protein